LQPICSKVKQDWLRREQPRVSEYSSGSRLHNQWSRHSDGAESNPNSASDEGVGSLNSHPLPTIIPNLPRAVRLPKTPGPVRFQSVVTFHCLLLLTASLHDTSYLLASIDIQVKPSPQLSYRTSGHLLPVTHHLFLPIGWLPPILKGFWRTVLGSEATSIHRRIHSVSGAATLKHSIFCTRAPSTDFATTVLITPNTLMLSLYLLN